VTAADLGSLPKKTVKVKTDHGVTTFEGVAIQDVLELAITQNGKPVSSADGPYRHSRSTRRKLNPLDQRREDVRGFLWENGLTTHCD